MSALPERLYLERYPEPSGLGDLIHYEPTGFGIDMRTGAKSEVHVYSLTASDDELAATKFARCIDIIRKLNGSELDSVISALGRISKARGQ